MNTIPFTRLSRWLLQVEDLFQCRLQKVNEEMKFSSESNSYIEGNDSWVSFKAEGFNIGIATHISVSSVWQVCYTLAPLHHYEYFTPAPHKTEFTYDETPRTVVYRDRVEYLVREHTQDSITLVTVNMYPTRAWQIWNSPNLIFSHSRLF